MASRFRLSLARPAAPRLRHSSPNNVPAGKNALTASGFRIRRREADHLRRLIQPWQTRSFAYYDLLGEIKYAAQFYSRSLSALRLYAAEIDANGDLVETEDPDAVESLDRIQDPGGGRSGLLGAYGRLMFLTGEAYLLVTQNEDTGEEQWEILSTDELRIQGGIYVRYKAPSLPAEELREPADDAWEPLDADHAIAYRIWQRHPRFSMLADSTMQGVLDLCEELVLLTQAVRARARSRMAGSGILLVDDRVSPAPLEPAADEDPQEDPFIADLTEAMTTPIVDEGAASAVVPFVIRVSVPDGMTVSDVMDHLQITDPTQLYPETGLRYECIKRIAIGLDMPPEILLGLMDANHWSGWMVDEQAWKAHLQPKAQQFVDDLTSSYFRPTLRDSGKADWQRFSIAYDATAIINHPDRSKDAKDLHDRIALGDRALREAAGFDEEDAPTVEELNRQIGIKVRDASLAVYGVPALRSQTELELAPGELEAPPAPGTGVEAATGVQPADVSKTRPVQREEQTPGTVAAGDGAGNGAVAGAARLLGAADLALCRAREVAGNRLLGLAKRDKAAKALCEGVPTGQVAATLGQETVRRLKAPAELELVAGARGLIEDALRMYDLPTEVAEKLATQIEQHAARTLYEKHPAPLPAAFTNYVLGLAGAGTA